MNSNTMDEKELAQKTDAIAYQFLKAMIELGY